MTITGKITLIFVAAVCLFLGCATPQKHVKSADPPSDAEPPAPRDPGKEMGKQFVKEARNQYQFIKDQEVVDAVNTTGRRLVTAAGGDPSSFHFFVVSEIVPNAFAIPGGYIFVFDGLLDKLDSEDELAGVLAHETGHVMHNHFFKDESKMSALNLATIAAILLSRGNPAATSIAMATNVSAQLQFSRENEEEADASGMEYLKVAGYDPNGMLNFFEALLTYEKINGVEIPAYLQTHPALGDRIHLVELRASRPPTHKLTTPLPVVDWGRIEIIIRAKSIPWKDPAQILPGQLSKTAPTERYHYLSGLAYLTADRVNEAIPEYQAALALAPGNTVYHADLATAYLKGRDIDHARSEAQESLRLSKPGEEPLSALLVLGLLDEHDGQLQEALHRYETVLERNPDHAFAHYHLGQVYFQTGDTLRGAYHTGRYLRLSLEPEAALREFTKAKSLSSSDAEMARKIQDQIDQIQRDGV